MEVTRHTNYRSVALGVLALTAAACSGGGSKPFSATLSVSLMDAPVDDVTAVNVEITAIWLKGPNGPAQQLPLAHSPMKVNLLSLTEDNAALLIDAEPIEPGRYEWLAMDMNADFDHVYDSYVDTSIGGQEEIRVPSGRVRLVSGFEIGPNQAVQLLFDWNLRSGLVDAPGQPGFLLKPAFRVVDVAEMSVLRGTVAQATIDDMDPAGCVKDDPNFEVGNSVYVFAGDVTPDDSDGADAEPIATLDVLPDSVGVYMYRTVIAPGTYTIAFTCQAKNDDPAVSDDLEFVGIETRTITADAEVVKDF
jgi:Domain of unknown function (DUF4382)